MSKSRLKPLISISRLFPCQQASAWPSTYRLPLYPSWPVAPVLGAPQLSASSSAASSLTFSFDFSWTVREADHQRKPPSIFLAIFYTGLSRASSPTFRADPVLMSTPSSVGTQVGLSAYLTGLICSDSSENYARRCSGHMIWSGLQLRAAHP